MPGVLQREIYSSIKLQSWKVWLSWVHFQTPSNLEITWLYNIWWHMGKAEEVKIPRQNKKELCSLWIKALQRSLYGFVNSRLMEAWIFPGILHLFTQAHSGGKKAMVLYLQGCSNLLLSSSPQARAYPFRSETYGNWVQNTVLWPLKGHLEH